MFVNDLFKKNITEAQTDTSQGILTTAKNTLSGVANKLGNALPQEFKPFDEKTYASSSVAKKESVKEANDPKELQQQINDLDEVIDDIKRLKQQSQKITTEIKYDNTAGDILARVDQLVQHIAPYVDNMDYKDLVDAVREAHDQLQSAIFGLDQIFDYAAYNASNKQEELQDMLDYPDEQEMEEGRRGGVIRSGSISEEQIDELSPKTLASYSKKAQADAADKIAQFKAGTGDKQELVGKAQKRVGGIKQAHRKYKTAKGIEESLRSGEYHIWTVYFADGTSQRVEVPSDEFDVEAYYAKKGIKVAKVDKDYGVHGHQTGVTKSDNYDDRRDKERKAHISHDRKMTEEGTRDPWSEKHFGPTQVIKKIFSVKTDGKKYRVRAATEKEAAEIIEKHAPDSNIISIKFVKNIMSEQGVAEAKSPAQQAAIAISMKKAGKKPKVTNEDIENYVESMQLHGYESIEEQKCPECGGVAYSDKMIAEEKDACYSKVKSRYKIWPSAYASGALVKCRKVGAKNWGNKSKK
ncbi:hypothetical protein UFOVP257_351 [uncultured Caudovirales phage]|uniref:Uncharacterized protein n=1 Tax=uncultured Caudovirales phage TaxID=2100421 RepID=A0A6J5LPG4_9CAUD|nr:hypothetical protein UFOVP257_351 [uncultured Caudovirales phage]